MFMSFKQNLVPEFLRVEISSEAQKVIVNI